VLLSFHLIGKRHNIANVKSARGEFLSNPEKYNDRDWRAGNRFLGPLLASLNSFRNGYFLFARE
jgi:hypothetical protein